MRGMHHDVCQLCNLLSSLSAGLLPFSCIWDIWLKSVRGTQAFACYTCDMCKASMRGCRQHAGRLITGYSMQKLGAPIGSQVLIAKAARDLVVLFHARAAQQLLELHCESTASGAMQGHAAHLGHDQHSNLLECFSLQPEPVKRLHVVTAMQSSQMNHVGPAEFSAHGAPAARSCGT